MRVAHKGLLLVCVPLLLLSATAIGGLNGIDVTIANDSTDDVTVTVYDLSTRPNSVVLANQRLNGFTRVPVSLSPDETGRGNLSWTAVRADPRSLKCGHATHEGLLDSASVAVHADTECTGT